MNEITRIYNDQPVRIIDRNGEQWFIAKDVAAILGYADAFSMTRRLDEDEQEKLETTEMAVSSSGHGGARQYTIINEPGLYSAILGSQKPEAKDFKRWVTHDVLPSIRRTGAYVSPAIGLEDCVSMVNKLSGQLHEIMEQNAILREKNAYLEQFEPKDEYGTVNANGKPKYQQRRGCYVSAKGTEPTRMDPDKNGYLQLDFFYDLVPTMLVDKIKGIVLNLRGKNNELPGGEA